MADGNAAHNIESLEDILSGLWFFSVLAGDLVDQLASKARLTHFSKGQAILTQGQMNNDLHFLLSGKVAVIVDGGTVAHLDQRGDLLGEMSVISRTPCAATLQAIIETDIVSINADEFQSIASAHSDHLQNNLNRLYAMVLADRLRITNQKAKHFESLNAELSNAQEELRRINAGLEELVQQRTEDLHRKTKDLEASHRKLESQNEALIVSHGKLEELYNTRDLTFDKLDTLYRQMLKPLRVKLSGLASSGAALRASDLQELGNGIDDLLKLLEPITSRYSTEKSIRSKRVLLAESNKKQHMVAKLALGGTGVRLDIAPSIDEFNAIFGRGESFDILLSDVTHLPLTTKVHESSPKTRIVFMNHEPIPNILPPLLQLPYLPNIVSFDPNDRSFTVKNIMTTVVKLASGNIFGLEKYLSWGAEIHEAIIEDSEKRADLIQMIDAHFGSQGVRRIVRENIGVVLEELLMNAIYDAPMDAEGHSLYNHLSRREKVVLKSEHQGRLRYATDGMLVAISVADPFGGLNGKVILKYLESCYGGTAGSMNTHKGGAGRGLHQIIEMSDLVVFNVAEKKKTEVIALFNVDPKDNGTKSASFHLFTEQ